MIRHDSQRGFFAYALYQQMKQNKDIFLVVGDLGYKVFDAIRDEMPERFLNVGAAECSLINIAIGLSLEGKIPFCYSITPFLLYRPFESLRTYVNHENIPIHLVGSGRDDNYKHDGFSHYAGDVLKLFDDSHFLKMEGILARGILGNIKDYWPQTKEEIPSMVKEMIENKKPSFISLTR